MNEFQRLITDFLESRQDLIQEHIERTSGFRATRRYADLMDQFVRSLFLAAGLAKEIRGRGDGSLAVVALGSYGRRELCLNSDVDLMVVHLGRLSSEMKALIPRALYPLWDAKLEVGHSILTVQECIRLAFSDFRVLTSIMDNRFILGSRSFHRLFEEAFWARIRREKDSFLNQFLIYRQKRREKFGTESYFVEPDIKEGLGGLRDLHFMSWMARTFFRCQRLSQMRRFSAFSHFQIDGLSQSNSFLLKVRNHLHILAKRKEDRLLLSYHKQLSRSLGYEDRRHIRGSERLMRDLYLHLNRIRYGSEEFVVKALDTLEPFYSEPSPVPVTEEFQALRDNLVLRTGRLSEKEPLIVLRALDEANRRGLFVGSGFIWEGKKIISREGKGFVASPEARKLFLNLILKPVNPKITRLALEIGLISLFIPEFKRIRNLVEPGFYHVETVDLHSLKALEVLMEISKGVHDEPWPIFRDIFEDLGRPDLLFMAALLHDIGKGRGGDHSLKGAPIALDIMKRLGFEGKDLEVVPFLVEHHLLLNRVSQHRDLGDEKTSVQVAQIIQDQEMLRMLFLLAVADGFSTGPNARSDWKIMLLTELFVKVRRILQKGVLASPDATKKIEENKRLALDALGKDFPRDEVLSLMDKVSSRYLLNTSPEDMLCHFRLAMTMGEERLRWKLQKLEGAPVTRIILCTYDKPGLFGKMVGVFTLNNMAVLSARISTLKNGLAFDIYDVTNPRDPYREKETWEKIGRDIGLALEDRLPLDDLIGKKAKAVLEPERYERGRTRRVRIDNEISDFFTVIEVAYDTKVGLLYYLAQAIFSLGLDIRSALFNSDEEKMTVDLYVRDSVGQKIHQQDRIQEIRQAILQVLSR